MSGSGLKVYSLEEMQNRRQNNPEPPQETPTTTDETKAYIL
jgi:hypothetical protein